MSNPPQSTTINQYFSEEFCLAAGSILFRRNPQTKVPQICVVYNRAEDRWFLPKGRKDREESMAVAAVRETFEETGYPCELLPCRMPTRVPAVGSNARDVVAVGEGVTEPFAITVRKLETPEYETPGTKFIWWFLTHVKDGAVQVAGTLEDYEDYESHFIDAEDAAARLPRLNDQELVKRAWDLVKNSEGALAVI